MCLWLKIPHNKITKGCKENKSRVYGSYFDLIISPIRIDIRIFRKTFISEFLQKLHKIFRLVLDSWMHVHLAFRNWYNVTCFLMFLDLLKMTNNNDKLDKEVDIYSLFWVHFLSAVMRIDDYCHVTDIWHIIYNVCGIEGCACLIMPVVFCIMYNRPCVQRFVMVTIVIFFIIYSILN